MIYLVGNNQRGYNFNIFIRSKPCLLYTSDVYKRQLSDNGKQHLPAQAQPGQPEVLFNDVTFAYQDKEVLHHISFAMKKNSMTALVGPCLLYTSRCV